MNPPPPAEAFESMDSVMEAIGLGDDLSASIMADIEQAVVSNAAEAAEKAEAEAAAKAMAEAEAEAEAKAEAQAAAEAEAAAAEKAVADAELAAQAKQVDERTTLLVEMGFTEAQAAAALDATQGSL